MIHKMISAFFLMAQSKSKKRRYHHVNTVTLVRTP